MRLAKGTALKPERVTVEVSATGSGDEKKEGARKKVNNQPGLDCGRLRQGQNSKLAATIVLNNMWAPQTVFDPGGIAVHVNATGSGKEKNEGVRRNGKVASRQCLR